MRVIGGLAIRMHSPSAQHRALSRAYGDLDMVGYRSQRRDIMRVLEDQGYEGNRRFNTLQGDRRLLFMHPEGTFDVDVFLDVFPMCHELDFVGRLDKDEYTVPIAELLLSKLQIVELNEKDVKDIYALVEDHELAGTDDPEIVDLRVITRLTGNDWGWYKTLQLNIDKVLGLANDYLAAEESRDTITGRLTRLREAIETTPKSIKWKVRARIGERVRWYELPEDMAGDVKAEGAHRGAGDMR